MELRGAKSFWWFATACFGAFGLYALALMIGGPDKADAINSAAQTLAPIAAAAACWSTARSVGFALSQRLAWNTMALACASWLIGQLIWDYYAFVQRSEPAFPSPSKIFYLAYAALTVRALGGLSDSTTPHRFTMQHLGNLGLIGCCLIVTIVIAFLEPVAQSPTPRFAVIGSLVHSALVAMTFFAALYYLWIRRWHATWLPMLLIVAATGVHTMGNFIYVHALLMQTYRPTDWVNVTWFCVFVLIGLAARLRASTLTLTTHARNSDAASLMTRRARLLEAIVPALLIATMVVVGVSAAPQLSPRVLVATAVVLLMFALILGAREAWIQGESQRLTLELRNANERLRSANMELQDSEARVRDLNAHLEERIAERTRQLQLAYEELEGFAYAVAHDLKAPLRAIDGFGHLLDESLRTHADEQTTGYLKRIRRGAVKMAALINDLLAYSRIERRALVEQTIDLRQLIDAVVAEHAEEIRDRGVDLIIDVPPLQLTADQEGLALVIRNVLQNALKFTRDVRPARIEISARSVPPGVELVVRDNGIGFDMQYHEQIFRLFHRLHRDDQYPGTGIGLALVRKALERMRGRVSAMSKEGEGSVFTIELPNRG